MIKSTLYKNNRVKLTVIYHLNKVLSYSFKQLHTIYEHAYAFIHLIGHTYTEQAWENPQIFFKR